jgi:phage terminase large subunit
MANNIDLKINEHFIPFFKTRKRYAISYGGAGSGKSVSIAQKIITRCLGEAKGGNTHRILCVRKVKSSIKESVFKLLRDQISDLELSTYVKVNQTDMSIRFNNGAEIITSGLDDVEKLKSITNITSVWIEEATELDEGDLTQLDLRLRGISPYYKQIMISFNPISETHFLKKRFFDIGQDDAMTLKTTYLDNKFIDEEYIKTLTGLNPIKKDKEEVFK